MEIDARWRLATKMKVNIPFFSCYKRSWVWDAIFSVLEYFIDTIARSIAPHLTYVVKF